MADKKDTDFKKIEDLIRLMKDNDLVEIEIVDGQNKILLKRPQAIAPTITHIPMMPAVSAGPAPKQDQPEAALPEEKENLVDVTSPIVGTFYSSPSPDSEPYVTIGSRVEPGEVICVVEAMKVMNEIKAEASGEIVEILCKTGEAVEYGQVIFKVRCD